MKKSLLIFLLVVIFVAGCSNEQKKVLLTTEKPVVITLWHSYNSYAKIILDQLITEFNDTVGLEKGIIVDSYTYGTAKELDVAIYNSAQNHIGSDPMPNIFSASPDSAYRVNSLRPLVPLTKYFNPKELAEYHQDFLEDGLVGEKAVLKIMPIAKSTEVIYLNKTDWDEFSEHSDYSIEYLKTWEDLFTVAKAYYEWSDGKAMFGINPLNTIMSITAQQLDTPVYVKENGSVSFTYSETTARKIWNLFYIPHLKGFYKSTAYSADGVKSGTLLSYLGSSAGAAYFPSEVTLNSQQVYPIKSMILPYPTFKNAKPYASQRGAGMCITTSDDKHEYAATEFLKWLTSPQQNITFSVNTGYLPVKNVALDSFAEYTANIGTTDIVNACNGTTITMLKTHKFYSEKAFDGYYAANNIFGNSIFDKIKNDLSILELRIKNGEDKNHVITELTNEQSFQKWYKNLQEKVVIAINSERK